MEFIRKRYKTILGIIFVIWFIASIISMFIVAGLDKDYLAFFIMGQYFLVLVV